MPVTPISGRSGRVQNNGTNWNFDDWQGTISTVTGTITGFEDQNPVTGRTAENRSDGNDNLKATIHGFIDTGLMPSRGVQTPNNNNFIQGSRLTNLLLVLDKSVVGRAITTGKAIVRQIVYHAKQADPAQAVTMEVENAGGIIVHPI